MNHGEQKSSSSSDLLKKRQQQQAHQQRQLNHDTSTEVEYLDSIFDDSSLEAEVQDLIHGGYAADSFENMRAFGPREDSDEVLNEIKKVRKLQQEIYHQHLEVEIDLNEFVIERSNKVSKAEQSATFCEDFRTEFAKRKKAMEGVSGKLSKLSMSVEKVNNMITWHICGTLHDGSIHLEQSWVIALYI